MTPPTLRTPEDYAERGPHPVGIATETVADPADPARLLPIDVWYPARSAPATPEAEHPFGQRHRAHPDAPPAAGPFPLIAFSHGNSGMRRQSTFLTTHLASWGFVVVAPDHTGNTFFDLLEVTEEERIALHRAARKARPRDLTTAIALAEKPGPRWPQVDAARLGALGHSFGGWTAFKTPRIESRARAICALAPASEPFVGRSAFEDGELPLHDRRPSLIVPGLDDTLVLMEQSTWPLFDRQGEPCAMIGVRDADHYHFCDGLELLHARHVANPREGMTTFPRPGAELLGQARMHRLLQGLVTCFFERTLREGCDDPFRREGFDAATLERFDRALERLSQRQA